MPTPLPAPGLPYPLPLGDLAGGVVMDSDQLERIRSLYPDPADFLVAKGVDDFMAAQVENADKLMRHPSGGYNAVWDYMADKMRRVLCILQVADWIKNPPPRPRYTESEWIPIIRKGLIYRNSEPDPGTHKVAVVVWPDGVKTWHEADSVAEVATTLEVVVKRALSRSYKAMPEKGLRLRVESFSCTLDLAKRLHAGQDTTGTQAPAKPACPFSLDS